MSKGIRAPQTIFPQPVMQETQQHPSSCFTDNDLGAKVGAVVKIKKFIGRVFISAVDRYTPPSNSGGLLPPLFGWWYITTQIGGNKPPVTLPPPQILMWWNISTAMVEIYHQCFYSVLRAYVK